jgi:hypothetical protein
LALCPLQILLACRIPGSTVRAYNRRREQTGHEQHSTLLTAIASTVEEKLSM